MFCYVNEVAYYLHSSVKPAVEFFRQVPERKVFMIKIGGGRGEAAGGLHWDFRDSPFGNFLLPDDPFD